MTWFNDLMNLVLGTKPNVPKTDPKIFNSWNGYNLDKEIADSIESAGSVHEQNDARVVFYVLCLYAKESIEYPGFITQGFMERLKRTIEAEEDNTSQNMYSWYEASKDRIYHKNTQLRVAQLYEAYKKP